MFLGLDAGSGGARCLVVDRGGAVLASAYRRWEFHQPPGVPFGAEFDPAWFWQVLCQVVREALARLGIPSHRVSGVGCTSFRDGVVFLGEDEDVVYAGSNRDARSLSLAGAMQRQWGSLMSPITGRTPLGLDAAAHLLWFRGQRPAEFARIRTCLMVSDWMVWKLTGEYSSDPSNASSSQLFDVNNCRWSPEIAAALGISGDLFPPVLCPGRPAGSLTPRAAEEMGLRPGIPVSVGLGDSQAGCLGCGAVEDGRLVVVAGTTIPVMMCVGQPVHDPARRTWTGAHAVPDRWVVESNGGMAGTLYEWVCQTMFSALCGTGPDRPAAGAEAGDAGGQRHSGDGTGEMGAVDDLYRCVEQMAAAEPPGQVLAFLGTQVADMSRLNFPPMAAVLMPGVAVTPALTRPRLARAVLENIAFAAEGNCRQCEAVAGRSAREVSICGGLSRSRLFAQILADCLGVPVGVPRVREASGLGAAMAAAAAAGEYPDLATAVRQMARIDYTAEPQASSAGRYRALAQRWKSLAARLAELK